MNETMRLLILFGRRTLDRHRLSPFVQLNNKPFLSAILGCKYNTFLILKKKWELSEHIFR